MTVTSRNGRLTPDQVQSITFPPARFGHRGLDEEHVWSFCAQVQRELVTLLNEKASLWEEVERLRRRIIGDGDAPGQRPEDAHIQAVRILSNAQQTADRYVADAQQYSRQLTGDARRRHDELLGEARVHAERMLEQAHTQASRAAELAAAGPVSVTNGEWRERTSELAYLRTFSEVYRAHLRTYLEALLANVEEWEQSEKSSLAAARSEPSPAAYPAASPAAYPAAYPSPYPSPSASPPPSTPPHPSSHQSGAAPAPGAPYPSPPEPSPSAAPYPSPARRP